MNVCRKEEYERMKVNEEMKVYECEWRKEMNELIKIKWMKNSRKKWKKWMK